MTVHQGSRDLGTSETDTGVDLPGGSEKLRDEVHVVGGRRTTGREPPDPGVYTCVCVPPVSSVQVRVGGEFGTTGNPPTSPV